MAEHPPLNIEYVVDRENGTFFGWDLDRSQINPYQVPIFDAETTRVLQEDNTLKVRVQEEILNFFKGLLSSDLHIPAGYPYDLYEKNNPALISSGKLRQ